MVSHGKGRQKAWHADLLQRGTVYTIGYKDGLGQKNGTVIVTTKDT